jgi:hypothetical protein
MTIIEKGTMNNFETGILFLKLAVVVPPNDSIVRENA